MGQCVLGVVGVLSQCCYQLQEKSTDNDKKVFGSVMLEAIIFVQAYATVYWLEVGFVLCLGLEFLSN